MRVTARQHPAVSPSWNSDSLYDSNLKGLEDEQTKALQVANTRALEPIEPYIDETDYIEGSYVDVPEEEGLDENTALADAGHSEYVNTESTAYNRFSQITSYDNGKLFMQDFEDYNNPYTDEALARAKRQILA